MKLSEIFAVLKPDLSVDTVSVSPSIYEELDSNYHVDMILRNGEVDECVSLSQLGSFIVVPAGTWHTARTSVASRMLFVTPGQGTENRAEV